MLRLPGVLAAAYDKEEDYFTVFESVLVGPDTIFAAVGNAGRSLGREYLPEIVSQPASS